MGRPNASKKRLSVPLSGRSGFCSIVVVGRPGVKLLRGKACCGGKYLGMGETGWVLGFMLFSGLSDSSRSLSSKTLKSPMISVEALSVLVGSGDISGVVTGRTV